MKLTISALVAANVKGFEEELKLCAKHTSYAVKNLQFENVCVEIWPLLLLRS
jgi:hypothetical protein